jgi:hypothetical protein
VGRRRRHLTLPPGFGVLLALALAGSFAGPGSPQPLPSPAPRPSATATTGPGTVFLDASDSAREALPQSRRSSTRLALRHVPPPALHPLTEASAVPVASGAIRPLATPVHRLAGGLPAGFLPDHALSPPYRA